MQSGGTGASTTALARINLGLSLNSGPTYQPLPTQSVEIPQTGNLTTSSSIASAVSVATSSPSITYLRASVGVAGGTFPDYQFVKRTSSPLSSSAGFAAQIDFDGTTIEAYVKGNGTSIRWWVDGAPATNAVTLPNDGAGYYEKITFSSRKQRIIRFEGGPNLYFGGFNVGPQDTVYPSPVPPGPRAIFLGDSFTEPTGSNYSFTGWATLTSEMLGWDDWLAGSGGTGYTTNGGIGGRYKFADRLTDVTSYNPRIVVVAGGINDITNFIANGAPAFTTQVDAVLGGVRSALPNLDELVVVGPFYYTGSQSTEDQIDAVLQTEATKYNATFIDTKGWITGSGHVGATTSTGNGNYYVGSDGTHPTQAGHEFIAKQFAQEYLSQHQTAVKATDLTRLEPLSQILSYFGSPAGLILGNVGQLLTRSDTGSAYINTAGATSTWSPLLQATGNLGFNLGIGTSSPFAKVSIQAGSTDTNTTLFAISSSTATATSTLALIDNLGNLSTAGMLTVSGSGTSVFSGSVQANSLNISGNVRFSSFGNGCFMETDSSGNLFCGSGGGGGSGGSGPWTDFGGGIRLATTSNQVLIGAVATSSLAQLEVHGSGYFTGNFGIGTSSPYAPLSVAGQIVSSYLTATSTAATSTFAGGAVFATGGGNVGVGISNALFVLDVSGPINTSANGGGYFQGGSSVLSASSTNKSIFIGTGAASLLSTTTTSGSVFIGYQSGATATTSLFNTAVGYQSLANLSYTVTQNGQQPSSFNTAVGYQALNANTQGNQNTALGYQALLKVTTGYNNVAVGGAGPAAKITSGHDNIAIGTNSLANVLGGFSNVALGSNAASFGIGNLNTAIGDNALRGSVGGSSYNNNTALGNNAGFSISTGNNNLFIGSNTGSTTTTGSNNIAIGYDIALLSASGSNQLNVGNLIFGTGINAEGLAISTGNIGIGTTTPYSRLTVWGTDAASSTLSFNVVNNASTTVFAVFNGGNAQLSGTLTQSSDRRLKTNIAALDASSSLASINSLVPVAYDWLDPEKGGVRQYGFIAQDVQQIFPNLIATTSATALTPGGTLGLNYLGLIAPIVKAVQQLSANIGSLASRVSSLEAAVAGFANSFHTQQLCVGSTCIDQQQLAGLLALEAQGQVQISAPTPPVIGDTSTPPSINIQGSNPATVNVGDTYNDLGAIVHDNQGHDLSYRTFINGVLSGNSLIDTSQVATDTIDYVATDTWGNTATSTRTVIVSAATSSI